MSEKCFCHLNGYEVKDAAARAAIAAIPKILYYDTLEAAEAANLPDGSFVAVPSSGESGGGGLEVIELSTHLTASSLYTESENALLSAAWEKGLPVTIKTHLFIGALDVTVPDFCGVASLGTALGYPSFIMSFGSVVLLIMNVNGGWASGIQEM